MKKLIILQSITPDYRKLFFDTIRKALNENFQIYAGDSYFEKSLKDESSIEKVKVKNMFLFGNRFLIQKNIWHLVFKNCVLVIEMNPRILTNWIILFGRKILGKKTVLWGHAWPRKGQQSKTDWIRGVMRFLGDKIIVYTNSQKLELQSKIPSKKILSAPNAVISSEKMITNNNEVEINNIIYVGRLTKAKKPLFLAKAFYKAIDKIPDDVKLIIVGVGDELKVINNFIVEKRLKDRVFLKGHVSDYETLKGLYFNSLFSVSPGYIGLSITQSFSFGVPMLISRNENHSPEIEAVVERENSIYFNTNDVSDCCEKIISFYKKKNYWIQKRESILLQCKENYSTEKMAQTFINLV